MGVDIRRGSQKDHSAGLGTADDSPGGMGAFSRARGRCASSELSRFRPFAIHIPEFQLAGFKKAYVEDMICDDRTVFTKRPLNNCSNAADHSQFVMINILFILTW